MIKQFHYTFGNLIGDYTRAVSGIILTVIPLCTVRTGPSVNFILGIFIVLFSLFAARTVMRHTSRIETTETELAVVGFMGRRLSWCKIVNVNLSYFSTWSDKRKGWMQLKIKGDNGTIVVDSSIKGFEVIASLVLESTVYNEALMNDITIRNFKGMGLSVNHSVKSRPGHEGRVSEQGIT